MKQFIYTSVLVCIAFIINSCNYKEVSGQYLKKSFMWQGKEREYLIYLPSSYQKEEKFPMVLGLHGYTGTATGFEKETTRGMNKHAEAHKFITVYPQGDHFWGKKGNYPFFVSSWNDIESNAPPKENEQPLCSKERDQYPQIHTLPQTHDQSAAQE